MKHKKMLLVFLICILFLPISACSLRTNLGPGSEKQGTKHQATVSASTEQAASNSQKPDGFFQKLHEFFYGPSRQGTSSDLVPDAVEMDTPEETPVKPRQEAVRADTPEEAPETPRQEATEADTMEKTPASSCPAVSEITIQFNRVYDETSPTEAAESTAFLPSGSVLWQYQSVAYARTELDRVGPIGTWQDRYLFVEDGTIIALDVQTGRELWRNTDYSGAAPFETGSMIDEDGTIYLCSYYGPDFFAASADGDTLCRIDSFSDQYYWAHTLQKDQQTITVTLAGGPDGYRDIGSSGYDFSVNLNDFSIAGK